MTKNEKQYQNTLKHLSCYLIETADALLCEYDDKTINRLYKDLGLDHLHKVNQDAVKASQE